MAEEEWLDADAAARHLGLPTGFVYAMVRAGQLPALRFPVRIRRRDLDGCLDRCRIKPGDLAHHDQNALRRGGSRQAPLTRRGTPDRRFGRRTGQGTMGAQLSSAPAEGPSRWSWRLGRYLVKPPDIRGW